VPLIANTSAIELQGHEALRHEFGAHMLCAVDWVGSMAVLDQRGCELLVEVGPGRTMKGLALRNLARVPCITTGSLGELDDAFRRLEEAACALS
jgi:malonyl CoA-acyl carrier protein transacylase